MSSELGYGVILRLLHFLSEEVFLRRLGGLVKGFDLLSHACKT